VAIASSCDGGGGTPGGADSDTDGDTDGDSDSDADTDTDSDGDADTDPGAGLVGSWGALQVTASLVDTGIPLIGEQWSSARAWALSVVTSDGAGALTLTEHPCLAKVKLGSGSMGSHVELPTAGLQNLGPTLRHVAVDGSGAGTLFVTDVAYSVRGANLCDEVNDPLPPPGAPLDDSTSCDLECSGSHCDEDIDGHPGVTTIMSGLLDCEVYAAARSWSRLDGQLDDADTISGAVVDQGSDQVVLAATRALCNTQSADAQHDGCDPHHYFRMVRLAPGATCSR
jgi:hypothetical protein